MRGDTRRGATASGLHSRSVSLGTELHCREGCKQDGFACAPYPQRLIESVLNRLAAGCLYPIDPPLNFIRRAPMPIVRQQRKRNVR
ncbi:hypothetical protein [Pararobbsia alpina]|uniref:hypothetical protein n=1 Tax=Pararobbsia alpina TaxID=621374 RepID=UPI0039A48E9E